MLSATEIQVVTIDPLLYFSTMMRLRLSRFLHRMIELIRDALRGSVPFLQFEKFENAHGAVLLLVTLQVSVCNFTKTCTLPWVLFTFFKL